MRGSCVAAIFLCAAMSGCGGGGGGSFGGGGGGGGDSSTVSAANAPLPPVASAAGTPLTPVVVATAQAGNNSVSSLVTGEPARPTAAFVDSIGINTQFVWGAIDYAQARKALVKLGVHHLRDGLITAPLPGYFDHLNDLANAGIHTTLITALTDDPVKDVAVVERIGNSLEAIEGPNETNVGAGWAAPLATFQKALYSAVKVNPHAAARIAVIGPALKSDMKAYAVLGDLSAYLDYGNMHDYAAGNAPGNGSISTNLAASARASANKPIISTETGYCTSTAPMGVTLSIMGRYVPRTFLEHFNAGVARTFEYQLLDDGDNASDLWSQCGLLTHEFAPKPAFTALANLIGLLADSGSAATSRLNYTLSAPDGVHHTLLQKTDKSFYLALWVEAQGYDPQRHAALTVAPQTVGLLFAVPVAGLVQYVLDDTGVLTPTPLPTISTSVKVTVSDRVTIVKIVP